MQRIIFFILFSNFIQLYGQSTVNIGAGLGVSSAKQKYLFVATDKYWQDVEAISKPTAFVSFEHSKDSSSLSFEHRLQYLDNISLFHNEISIPGQPSPSVVKFTLEYKYIQYSLALRYSWQIKHSRFYIEGSPIASILIDKQLDPLAIALEESERNAKFGLGYGLGYEYRLKKFGYFVQFSHGFDLTPMVKTPASSQTSIKINSNYLSAGLGLRFYLSGSETLTVTP